MTISAEESFLQANLSSSYIYFPEIAALAAVDLINKNPSILPGITITVKRFSDCGPWYPAALETYFGASGGWAASLMFQDIYENNPDVIGVIGNEYSTTTLAIAEELSLVEIPYCSATSASPRLSDKKKYPYFWRTITALGIGDHICQVLLTWNVQRVAIIYQRDDDMGAQS
ncbi:hypothetical protein HK100_012487 [Physocladia obscura]|uniref:Receptor ligand binding region domain-containing protein n=1 Tax=Physocladia obscura TaxID=109957 RepID=A0AAD5XLX7_9FUNG|nr:hypothetical protein HK100_012487 [Physocladia obscura]